MTNRELFRAIMHYGTFDRMPVLHWYQWPETLERWHREGLPEGVAPEDYFGAAPRWADVGADVDLFPLFDEETLEETAEYRVFRDGFGVVQKDWKQAQCIPHFIDFSLKSAADWPRFKERLKPDPARIPADLDEQIRATESSGLPVMIRGASMMGWIRNWMGVENMSFLMYDDPACYADMVDTLSDLAVWALREVAPRLSEPPDLCYGWEDICGKSGPLVSPAVFDRAVAPGYRKMRAACDELGIRLLGLDSDGWIEPLVPHWLEAGVNFFLPAEPGTWGATPARFRERFGREMRIMGGFDKRVLARSPAEIDAEIERHLPVMKEGGLILLPDHHIPPETPLSNYAHYIERIRTLRF